MRVRSKPGPRVLRGLGLVQRDLHLRPGAADRPGDGGEEDGEKRARAQGDIPLLADGHHHRAPPAHLHPDHHHLRAHLQAADRQEEDQDCQAPGLGAAHGG